ncbi:uncharacterized protein OCT59_024807 [Rhizophagus irregularis]|uniref:uncharacterized protein n=1 Tax=Rhizophagus irregularis TaxID=588596 RepID=UPI003331EBC8|nr:hypothetical protein OCT59_024807 [Rhizophagus irregularis]
MEHISHKRLQSFIENEGKREDKGVGLGLWVGWECEFGTLGLILMHAFVVAENSCTIRSLLLGLFSLHLSLGMWVRVWVGSVGLGLWVGGFGCGLRVWVEVWGWEWVGSVV